MDESDETGIEQYSDESREALRQRTDALIAGLRTHADVLLDLHGGAAEMQRLFDTNDTLEALVQAWHDAVSDHSGTFPLLLGDRDDDDLDEDDEDEEFDLDADVLSIVTRVDLAIHDPDALLAAGRAAYRRVWPQEDDEDAGAGVPDVAQALYTITHDADEPWLDVPGTILTHATRAYVIPDQSYEPPTDEDEDDAAAITQQLAPPPGTLVFRESWQ